MAKQRNMLPLKDSIRLANWMQSKLQDIQKQQLTQVEVAELASKELEIPITTGNIQRIASDREDAFIKFRWSRNGHRPKASNEGLPKADLRTTLKVIDEMLFLAPAKVRNEMEKSGLLAEWTSVIERHAPEQFEEK